jgi:hypothetical protein
MPPPIWPAPTTRTCPNLTKRRLLGRQVFTPPHGGRNEEHRDDDPDEEREGERVRISPPFEGLRRLAAVVGLGHVPGEWARAARRPAGIGRRRPHGNGESQKQSEDEERKPSDERRPTRRRASGSAAVQVCSVGRDLAPCVGLRAQVPPYGVGPPEPRLVPGTGQVPLGPVKPPAVPLQRRSQAPSDSHCDCHWKGAGQVLFRPRSGARRPGRRPSRSPPAPARRRYAGARAPSSRGCARPKRRADARAQPRRR